MEDNKIITDPVVDNAAGREQASKEGIRQERL